MQNLPKIVREQLKAGTSVANHPDADVLTAFAEKSLSALERDGVLEHLARCHDCRDIVALALPETEAATVVVPARGGWLTWPALRWGFAAAGVVLIASLGIVQYRQHSQTAATVAKSRPELAAYEGRSSAAPAAATPAAATEEKPDAVTLTAAAPAPAQNSADKDAAKSQVIAHNPAPPPPPAQFHSGLAGAQGGVTAGAAQFGPRAPAQWQQQQQAARVQVATPMSRSSAKQQANMASNLNVPSPVPPVEVAGAAPPITGTTGEAQSQPLDFRDEIGKAKAPVAAETATGFPQKPEADKEPQELPVAHNAVNGRNVTQLVSNFIGPVFRWTISPAGVLRRSLDQGNTWQDIDVTASQGAAAQAAVGAAVAKTDLAREKSAEAKQSAVIFRVVTASGREVWAGGSNGALYHSTDTGNHWTRILPQADGIALTGDIVSIQFSDPQHGGVLTSTGETWTTSDSGQTWHKQ